MAKQKSKYTARTMQLLREKGVEAYPAFVDKVEQPWNKYSKVSKDLYGIFDILALEPFLGSPLGVEYTLYGIQVTSRSNMSSRIKKILNEPAAKAWLSAGCKIEVWGWDQPKGPRTAWRCKVHEVSQLGVTGKCPGCDKSGTKPHSCPFKDEIDDDQTPCTCCKDCEQECSLEM